MEIVQEIYTGTLDYKGIEFNFILNGNELRLVPPKDKVQDVYRDFLTRPLGNGAYTMNIPVMEESHLLGKCNESAKQIIFITRKGRNIGSENCVLLIEIQAYILCKYKRNAINRIRFSNSEIDCIHPINSSFSFTFGESIEEFNKTGILTITTKDWDATTTQKQEFNVDGTIVSAYFGVSRGISTKLGESPLSLKSSLMFEFESTDNFEFIYRLWHIAKNFLCFLCYRKNVYLPTAELDAPCEDGKHENFAVLYVLGEDKETELDELKKGKYIQQQYIVGAEGAILSDIASDMLYLRHLPHSHSPIDAARFIMITAAFEWEFHRNYPQGIPRNEETTKVETEVSEVLQNLVKSNTGKAKKKYKFLLKLVKSDSLQSEIEQIGRDYGGIVDIFGENLYALNHETLNYSEMGTRLADQRNHFAHGDLDRDFIGLSLLDLIFLQFVIYAMQLKYYGVEEINVKRAINDLFARRLLIPDDSSN